MAHNELCVIGYPKAKNRLYILKSLSSSWLVVLRIYLALSKYQPYRNLEAGDNQISEIVATRQGIKPWTNCYTTQELNHYTNAASSKINTNDGRMGTQMDIANITAGFIWQ